MLLDEVFRQSAVEPFDRAVHLGTARVGVVVVDVERSARIMEEVGELRAVVGLYFCDGERSDFNEFLEKVGGGLARVPCVRAPKGEAVLEVDGGVDVAFGASHKAYDSINLETALLFGTTYLRGLSYDSLAHLSRPGVQGDLAILRQEVALLETSEDAACFRFRETTEDGDLLLAKARMCLSEVDNPRFELCGNDSFPPLCGCGTSLVETADSARVFFERFLPAVQGATRDAECFPCRFVSVLLPEDEDPESAFCFLVVVHCG